MSNVRQYIGARYVPIFDGVWDNTKAYEPLTIVSYQGNSFTSRQPVPIGIDINNNEFWAETGNYNAQIEQYRQEVLTFNNRINSNTDAIEENTNAIEENTAAIETNTNRITELTKNSSRFNQSAKGDYFPAITDGWFTLYSGRYFENSNLATKPFIAQGMAVDGNDIYVVVTYSKQTSGSDIISEGSNYVDVMLCNRVSNTVTKYASNILMGHCNTMTYSPITDCFYVIPGQSNLADGDINYHNVMFIYDKQFQNMQRVYCPGTVGCISYDHVTEKLVYADNETGFVYDVDEQTYEFTKRDGIFLNRNQVHYDQGIYIFQGGAIYNDFYVTAVGWNGVSDPSIVVVYDLKSGKMVKNYIFPECTDVFPLGELEDMSFDEHGMMYIAGSNVYGRDRYLSAQTTIFRSPIFSENATGNHVSATVPDEIVVLNSNEYYPTHSSFGFTFKEINEALCYAAFHNTTNIRIKNPTNSDYWYKGFIIFDSLRCSIICENTENAIVGIEGQILARANACITWYNGLNVKLPYEQTGAYPIRIYDSIFLCDKIDIYPGNSIPGGGVQILNTVMACMNGTPTLHNLSVNPINTARINGFGWRTTPFTGE